MTLEEYLSQEKLALYFRANLYALANFNSPNCVSRREAMQDQGWEPVLAHGYSNPEIEMAKMLHPKPFSEFDEKSLKTVLNKSWVALLHGDEGWW